MIMLILTTRLMTSIALFGVLLPTFGMANQPICDPIAFIENNTVLQWACRISKMSIALPTCQFTYSSLTTNQNQEEIPKDFINTTVVQERRDENEAGGSSSWVLCTLELPLAQVYKDDGSESYRVTVDFNADNNGTDNENNSTADISTDIILSKPRALITGDCKNEYVNILANWYGLCQCKLVHPGNPPGHAQWLDASLNTVGERNGNDSELTLVYRNEAKTPEYRCESINALGVGSREVRSFWFAYFKVRIDALPKEVFWNKCPDNNSKEIQIDCKLTGAIYPSANLTFEIRNSAFQLERTIVHDPIRWMTHYLTPEPWLPVKSGARCVFCGATNSIFEELGVGISSCIYIHTPPESSPVISVNGVSIQNGRLFESTVGGVLDIGCSVEGGWPEVENVTLSCYDQKTNNKSYYHDWQLPNSALIENATVTLVAEREMGDNLTCVCFADHVTNCYDKKSYFMLSVKYPPTNPPILVIEGMKEDSEETVPLINKQQMIKIGCRVENGSPRVDNITIKCGNQNQSGFQIVSHFTGNGNDDGDDDDDDDDGDDDDDTITNTQVLDMSLFRNGQGGEEVTKVSCECSAQHVTGLYDKTTTVTFTLKDETSSSRSSDNSASSVAVSTLIGIVVGVCVVSCLSCFLVGMKVKEKRLRDKKTKEGVPKARPQNRTDSGKVEMSSRPTATSDSTRAIQQTPNNQDMPHNAQENVQENVDSPMANSNEDQTYDVLAMDYTNVYDYGDNTNPYTNIG